MFWRRKYIGRLQTVSLAPVKEIPVLIPDDRGHDLDVSLYQMVVVSFLAALDEAANDCGLDVFQGDLLHIGFVW